jgi:glycosyltransferase involved in cell wall biosynthesis
MTRDRSIGVMIPTRNSASLLAAHLQSLEWWIDLADEIVVVDSNSTDGTLEMLQARLKHPKIKFLSHPPGLYQSWNFGIQNVGAEFVYVSTVGDSITRDGVEHLAATARELCSDVVISKPRFIDEAGAAQPDDRWAIDDIIERLKIERTVLLTPEEQFIFAISNTWGAILGSSASNLYRTATLQKYPFPTEFGTAGDGGWGVLNALRVAIAVTPLRLSTFRQHEKSYSMSDYRVESLALKLFRVGEAVLSRERELRRESEGRWRDLKIDALLEAVAQHLMEQGKLEACRHGKLPWILNPAAWRARSRRAEQERRMDAIKSEIAGRFRQERAARQGRGRDEFHESDKGEK